MALTIFWGIIWVIVAIMGGDFGKTFCRVLTGLAGIGLITIGIIHTVKPGYFENDKPTAMDVYQGKTRLEVHYTDTIPTDSVVVYLDKYKREKQI